MLLHSKSIWRQPAQASRAAQQLEQPLALLAQKEVVVMPPRTFIMRCHSGYFHSSNLPFADKLIEGPIHCCDSE